MFALAQAQVPVSLRRNSAVASKAGRGIAALRTAVRAKAGMGKRPPGLNKPDYTTNGGDDAPKGEGADEQKMSWSGLGQLVKMGLGTVSGDITEINLDDPLRTVVMELEANNFEDAEGNPLNFIDNEARVEREGKRYPILSETHCT
jgi:hypothetical protein